MVTVEAALVIPTLLVVLLAAAWGLAGVWATVRCSDAAQVAARAVADGASLAAARGVALADAPAGASVAVAAIGRSVRIRVTLRRDLLGGVLTRLPLTASATVTAWAPPGRRRPR
jgi:Flp pilus assembly protein TadG